MEKQEIYHVLIKVFETVSHDILKWYVYMIDGINIDHDFFPPYWQWSFFGNTIQSVVSVIPSNMCGVFFHVEIEYKFMKYMHDTELQ